MNTAPARISTYPAKPKADTLLNRPDRIQVSIRSMSNHTKSGSDATPRIHRCSPETDNCRSHQVDGRSEDTDDRAYAEVP